MSGFAVLRHTETGLLGIAPAGSLEMQRANGWIRVSDFRTYPSDFHLPEFADATDDLDAEPEPEPAPKKRAAAKTWSKDVEESSE